MLFFESIFFLPTKQTFRSSKSGRAFAEVGKSTKRILAKTTFCLISSSNQYCQKRLRKGPPMIATALAKSNGKEGKLFLPVYWVGNTFYPNRWPIRVIRLDLQPLPLKKSLSFSFPFLYWKLKRRTVEEEKSAEMAELVLFPSTGVQHGYCSTRGIPPQVGWGM